MTTSNYSPVCSEDLLNPLSRIMDELKKLKEKKDQMSLWEEQLKEELEAHHFYGNIKDDYSKNGIKVSRRKKPVRYDFSEMVGQLEQEVKKRKKMEIEDEIAIARPLSYTWAVAFEQ
tara:strand:+ start:3114 stop:3464 length:351 start_codon:yes stop_codon:yes gene_type:complete